MSDETSDVLAERCGRTTVLRPRRGRSHGRSRSAGVVWMLASVLYSLRFHGTYRIAVVGVGVVMAGAAVGLMNLSMQRTRLTMSGGQLIFFGLCRKRTLLTGRGLGRVVDVEVDWGSASARRSRLWLLLDAAGCTVLGLNCEAWDGGQLESLRQKLGIPIEVIGTPKRPAELRASYPGSIAWWAVRPVAATVLAIAAIAASVLALQYLVS